MFEQSISLRYGRLISLGAICAVALSVAVFAVAHIKSVERTIGNVSTPTAKTEFWAGSETFNAVLSGQDLYSNPPIAYGIGMSDLPPCGGPGGCRSDFWKPVAPLGYDAPFGR